MAKAVVWRSPSENSSGSMPLGNGDLGINLWAQANGSVQFYLGKTDAWSENGRLLKLGRIRIQFSPNPFKDASFCQTLDPNRGTIDITATQPANPFELRLWVDANHPVIRVQGRSGVPVAVQVHLENWRSSPRQTNDPVERQSFCDQNPPTAPYTVHPDTVITQDADNRIIWYHRNEHSIWSENLKFQGLEELADPAKDPLLHLTFGAAVKGAGFNRENPYLLETTEPATEFNLAVFPLTRQSPEVDGWRQALDKSIADCNALPLDESFRLHCQWWRGFWSRSSIEITGDAQAERVNQAYDLHRFILACAGRGKYPVKFNGSIFNVDWPIAGEHFDADYRRWGGAYWFQNTRLMYWSMLNAGDFEMIEPLFDMYHRALELARTRNRKYYDAEGAFFPETMTFWGTFINRNYGFDRTGKHCSEVENGYIKRYWQGGIELVALMLDYYEFTENTEFLQRKLLPLADNILKFYSAYYHRCDDEGKILFHPAQSLETWHEAVNPLPVIAGLKWILGKLRQLPPQYVDEATMQYWTAFREKLPPLPTRTYVWQRKVELIPALQYDINSNTENPELYAVFPYRLFGLGKPDLQTALNTWQARLTKRTGGWSQDAIQAALLGLTEQAQSYLCQNVDQVDLGDQRPDGIRFEAFYGPNHDWIPDMDHGSVTNIALQKMLMQCDDGKIRLLPSWPRNWNVTAKLRAPRNTTVSFTYRHGKMVELHVDPPRRKDDVIIARDRPPDRPAGH